MLNSMLGRWAQSMFAFSMLFIVGCSGGLDDAPDLFPVSGTVTLDGNPLEKGNIVFEPADGLGRPDGAAIENGKYSLTCTQGEKIVRITATKEVPAEGGGDIPDYISIIPEKYNEKSELKASIKAESGDGANPNNFELTSK